MEKLEWKQITDRNTGEIKYIYPNVSEHDTDSKYFLGAGAFGTVYMGYPYNQKKKKKGKPVAIKKISYAKCTDQ